MVNRRSSSNNSNNNNAEANDTTNNEATTHEEDSSTISPSSSVTVASTSANNSNNRCSNNKNLKNSNNNIEQAQTERLNNENGLSNICSTSEKQKQEQESSLAIINQSSSSTSSCEDTMTENSVTNEKVICSLPLERLSGILGTLAQSKRENSNLEPHNNKILCLYCDRTFSLEKLYKKHVERVHKLVEGRRTSIRTTTVSTTTLPTNDSDQTAFPGCSFCPLSVGASGASSSGSGGGGGGNSNNNSGSSNKQQINMVTDDLDALFNHLVVEHKDKYFACKSCTIRYSNEDNLAAHMKNIHNVETPKKLPLTRPLSVVVDFEEEILARAAALRKDGDGGDVRLTRSSKINNDRRNDLSAKEQMLIRLGKLVLIEILSKN